MGATKEIDSKVLELSDRVEKMEKMEKLSTPKLIYRNCLKGCYLFSFIAILFVAVITGILMYYFLTSTGTSVHCGCGYAISSLTDECAICPTGYSGDGTKCIQCVGNTIVSANFCFCQECPLGTSPLKFVLTSTFLIFFILFLFYLFLSIDLVFFGVLILCIILVILVNIRCVL